MKKALIFLTLLLLAQSCVKEVEVSSNSDTSSEAISFTALVTETTDTKSTLKYSWSEGDEIAIFVDYNYYSFAYRYTVTEDGTMSPFDADNTLFGNADSDNTYVAFYPYDADLTTIEDYEAACTTGSVDYMQATKTTSDKEVELLFTHSMAALSFTLMVEGSISNPAVSITLDGDLNNTTPLVCEEVTTGPDISRVKVNCFVLDNTDISSAMLLVDKNGSTSIITIKRDGSNIVTKGTQYPFLSTIGYVSHSSAGSGTEADPYVVYFADEMRKVGSGIDGWGLSSYYELAQDIDLGGIDADGNGVAENEFSPIGTSGSSSTQFKGSFNGNEHEIRGLYINQSSSYQALFGYINGATIKNIGVSGSVTGTYYVAGIAAYATTTSTIENCYNKCTVTGSSFYISGIVANASSTTIKNCYNMGSIKGSGNGVGGIVGGSTSSVTIENCHNTGSIIGDKDCVGGIVGEALASTTSTTNIIKNSYNTGKVEATALSTDNPRVGGIVGNILYYTVEDCYNTGSVTGAKYYTAGIAGCDENYSTIKNCYNIGLLYASSVTYGIIGSDHVNGTYLHCYYDNELGSNIYNSGVDNNDTCIGLSTANMKGDAGTEGTLLYYFTNNGSSSWEADTNNINDGYPILSWQVVN